MVKDPALDNARLPLQKEWDKEENKPKYSGKENFYIIQ
jgi:hypothetical protein